MPADEQLATAFAPATIAVTAGRPARQPDGPLNQPVVFASTYHAPGDVGYGRYANPSWTAFEQALGSLEGGTAVAFASGMAAVTAVLSLVPDGSVVVAPVHAYAGTLELFAREQTRGRIALRLVDVADATALARAAVGARLVWLETPTNPMLEVADVAAAAQAAHEAGGRLVVDNTFATPVLKRPIADGADVVVHSATKYLSGHSDVLLGAAVAIDPQLSEQLAAHRSLTGSVPGPMEAFLALRGLRTLHLRVERAQSNAAVLAQRLRRHPAVTRVRYPSFGAVVAVELAGGPAAADAVSRSVQLWVHATSLGGVESSLERRRRWPSESPQVPESLLRLSVGIEDVDDLWRDLARALDAPS